MRGEPSPGASRRRIAAALLLVSVLAACLTVPGCGGGEEQGTGYTVRQDGTVIGSQTVGIERGEGGTVYSATEEWPFLAFDTTREYRLEVSQDEFSLVDFSEERSVPGATYSRRLSGSEEGYFYLSDDLQTFEYNPEIVSSRGFLPLEVDSVCLVQGLLDKFLAANVELTSALVLVPSRSPVFREVGIEMVDDDTASISGEGVRNLEVTFDDEGTVERMEIDGGYLSIERGDAGRLTSRPYEPEPEGYRIQRVEVPAFDTEELTGSLFVPSGEPPYSAVVVMADFGPMDWTGAGFSSEVAGFLAGRGFMVLTCDKRGVPESGGDYATYTLGSAVEDLNWQVDYLALRGDIDVNRIGVVGHGEGALVAYTAAAANPYISGCVLMSAPAVRMWPDLELVRAEAARERGEITELELTYEKGSAENILSLLGEYPSDTIEIEGQNVFLGWMRSQQAADPGKSLAGLEVPVLVVQGLRDEVVPPGQADELMRILGSRESGEEELVAYESLGHFFGGVKGQGESRPYRSHAEIEPEVLEAVSGWLEEALEQ